MMQPSRRQVLRLGFVAAAAAGPLALTERVLAAVMPARLARRTFTPLVGSSFSLLAGGQTYEAVLASVDDLPDATAGDPYRFGLMFTVRKGGPDQGTYSFRHKATGSLSLFVVPVGGGRESYEAVVIS